MGIRSYKAVKENVGVYLSDSSQIEEFMNKGCTIIWEEDGKETIVATPERGLLAEIDIQMEGGVTNGEHSGTVG